MLYQSVPLRAQAAPQANTLDGTGQEHMGVSGDPVLMRIRSINATDRAVVESLPGANREFRCHGYCFARAADSEPV